MDASVGSLLILGAVSIIAAIVGGNVKLPGGTEFGPLGKPLVRVCLFAAGGCFFLIALGIGIHPTGSSPGDGPDPAKLRDKYAKSVVPICQRWRGEMAQLKAPSNGGFESNQAVAEFYENAGNIAQSWAAEMNAAEAPSADKVALSRIYNHLHSIGADMLDLASAAIAEDKDVALEAAGRVERRIKNYNTASESYGLDARCQWGV